MGKQRDRGRILTEAGKEKIKQAIRAWEFEHERRCTQEKLKELTGLDPTTSSKILNAKGGADRSKIEDLFRAFGLPLEESDLRSTLSITTPEPNPNFVGREDAISDLNALIQRGAKLIVIQARGGVGKTTLAWEYLKTQGFDLVLELWMAKETQNIASVEGVLEEWLRRYFDEEPGREFGVTLERLRQKLRDPNQKIGILIDNLEPALDQSGKFIEAHRRYVELMRVLSDRATQSVTLITSRERLQEVDFGIEHYLLRSLDQQAWQEFFEHHGIQQDEFALAELHRAYGGNAKAMEILRSVVQADFGGNLAQYWQTNQDDLFIERALEDLVVQQFDRLQQHDLNAYNLLCRMGCYRFQDVPTVPLQGLLCLLWDVPESKRRRVVRSLQERSLVEFENNSYFLHPTICSESIKRLIGSNDWEDSNCKAAQFWLETVKTIDTVHEAIQVYEAYHHYIQTKSFEQASSVILLKKPNQWNQNLQLGKIFHRLGLFQKLLQGISQITDKVNSDLSLYQLYSLKADINWTIGNVREAIIYQEQARHHLNNFSVPPKGVLHSLLRTSIYLTYLWELQEAKVLLDEILSESKDRESLFDGVAAKASCYLAFIKSIENLPLEANNLADKAYAYFICRKQRPGSFTYHGQILGLAYINLQHFERAFEIFNYILTFVENSEYLSSKAKLLTCIAQLYREQNKLDVALDSHLRSTNLLDDIGAKSELAEAYYQLGLTYKAMGEANKAEEKFQDAFQLFTDMEAPRQLERVKKSMNIQKMEEERIL